VPGGWLSTASVRQEAGPWVATVTVENRGSGHIAVEVATVKGERFPERTEEEATKGPAQPAPDYPTDMRMAWASPAACTLS